jgi:hypothetical protein
MPRVLSFFYHSFIEIVKFSLSLGTLSDVPVLDFGCVFFSGNKISIGYLACSHAIFFLWIFKISFILELDYTTLIWILCPTAQLWVILMWYSWIHNQISYRKLRSKSNGTKWCSSGCRTTNNILLIKRNNFPNAPINVLNFVVVKKYEVLIGNKLIIYLHILLPSTRNNKHYIFSISLLHDMA